MFPLFAKVQYLAATTLSVRLLCCESILRGRPARDYFAGTGCRGSGRSQASALTEPQLNLWCSASCSAEL